MSQTHKQPTSNKQHPTSSRLVQRYIEVHADEDTRAVEVQLIDLFLGIGSNEIALAPAIRRDAGDQSFANLLARLLALRGP